MEVIGILGTLFIILAFTRNGELQIRVFDVVGATLFVIYGITISSFSTILLNGLLIVIQIYKIIKLKKEKKV